MTDALTLSPKIDPRWTPRRNGRFYGSDACCRAQSCLWEDYVRVTAETMMVAAQLGPAWETHVWENLGWHGEVYDSTHTIHVSRCRNGSFWAYISSAVGDMDVRWEGTAATPQAAIRLAQREMKRELLRLSTLAGLVEPVIAVLRDDNRLPAAEVEALTAATPEST